MSFLSIEEYESDCRIGYTPSTEDERIACEEERNAIRLMEYAMRRRKHYGITGSVAIDTLLSEVA